MPASIVIDALISMKSMSFRYILRLYLPSHLTGEGQNYVANTFLKNFFIPYSSRKSPDFNFFFNWKFLWLSHSDISFFSKSDYEPKHYKTKMQLWFNGRRTKIIVKWRIRLWKISSARTVQENHRILIFF